MIIFYILYILLNQSGIYHEKTKIFKLSFSILISTAFIFLWDLLYNIIISSSSSKILFMLTTHLKLPIVMKLVNNI